MTNLQIKMEKRNQKYKKKEVKNSLPLKKFYIEIIYLF